MNKFENDVNRYGTQTSQVKIVINGQFENDVNRYGTQTAPLVRRDCPVV